MTEPVNNFETNITDHHRRRGGGGKGSSARRAIAARRPNDVAPTPERLAKTDAPVRMGSGLYRAPAPIERMRDRNQLDVNDPQLNEMMFQAAEKLVGYFEGAGLSGSIQAQDLTRVVAGGGDPASGMPASEHAAHCRKAFRTACVLMGWPAAHPHRGAARLTVAVVCYGQGVKEASAIYRPGGSDAARLGAGMDVLREGLFALAVHWRMIRA